jgi:DNA-binding HxlR family transcriptional regulator
MLNTDLPVSEEKKCIAGALLILGDKWTALIIREMSSSPQKFSNLEKNLNGISPRTLSQRLEKLTEHNIINKKLYCDKPPRYNYFLTRKGEGLKQILEDMVSWSDQYS